MFSFDTPFFPGLLMLLVIFSVVVATRKRNEPRKPVKKKYILASIAGVTIVSLIGLVGALMIGN